MPLIFTKLRFRDPTKLQTMMQCAGGLLFCEKIHRRSYLREIVGAFKQVRLNPEISSHI